MSANLSALHAFLQTKLGSAAQAYAKGLHDKLDQVGSGTHWPENPNPSSTPEEYPSVQTGALRDSISAEPDENGGYLIGSFDGPSEALDLVVRPPGEGGRDYITRAMHDDELHRAALEAMK